MSNKEAFIGVRPEEWNDYYNAPEARAQIDARQAIYRFTAGDQIPLKLETEALAALMTVGVEPEHTGADIGCSKPRFLEQWRRLGHTGRLIGVEPNAQQFNGMPFWEPLPANEVRQTVKTVAHLAMFTALHRPVTEAAQERQRKHNIELVQATVNRLPFIDGEIDALTSMFMMYHVEPKQQQAAFNEMKRVLNKDHGVFAQTTRANNNKEGMREDEGLIGNVLSEIVGELVSPPAPINSGYTSEDARRMIPEHFKHVYEFNHPATLVIDTRYRFDRLLRAHRTLRGLYVTTDGRTVSDDQFEFALRRVFRERARHIRVGTGAIFDKKDESLFIAADRELTLPLRFEKVKRLAP